MRGVFDEEALARVAAERLERDGFSATVSAEAFAGEDDDEDRSWVLTCDCPPTMLELVVDDCGGWADEETATEAYVEMPPLDLPVQPRRRYRPE